MNIYHTCSNDVSTHPETGETTRLDRPYGYHRKFLLILVKTSGILYFIRKKKKILFLKIHMLSNVKIYVNYFFPHSLGTGIYLK